MRRYLMFALFVLLPVSAWAKPGVSVYVCAHPDDCFLFMNPNLYDDVVAGSRVVVVYLTSGDAGLAFAKNSSSYPYVRELASIDAMEWMADVGKNPVRAWQKTDDVTVAGHVINRVGYANTVSYFLRLPDGNMDGNGFERFGNQSLRKLKSGEISGVTPIDGAVAYTDWQDLLTVLEGILSHEAEGEKQVTVHIAEPDVATNVNDHSDHTTGAGGMMEVLAKTSTERCYRIFKHIDYSIAEKPINLDGVALQDKAGSFAVLTATQRHFLEYHNWDEAHLSYVTRNYFSSMTLPDGCDAAPKE